MPYADRFWLYVAIAFGSLIALHFITKYLRGRKTRVTVSVSETPGKRIVKYVERSVFVNGVLIAVCVVTVLYSVLHIFHGKCHSWSSDFLVDQAINGEVELPEGDFYRIDFYRKEGRFTNVFDNLGLFWQIPSVENFHTVVPATIMEFLSRPTASPARSARAWNRNIMASNRCCRLNIRLFLRQIRRSMIPSGLCISTRRTGLISMKTNITSGWALRLTNL